MTFTHHEKFIQEEIGVFLYYRRAVDSTMLTARSAIASAQAKPTEETMACCKKFLTMQQHTKMLSLPTQEVTWY